MARYKCRLFTYFTERIHYKWLEAKGRGQSHGLSSKTVLEAEDCSSFRDFEDRFHDKDLVNRANAADPQTPPRLASFVTRRFTTNVAPSDVIR